MYGRAPTPKECQTAINRALALLAVPPGARGCSGAVSTDLYAEVADAAPNALIVVTGYPLLFELVQGDPTSDLKAQINSATAALNLTIKTAVESAQKQRRQHRSTLTSPQLSTTTVLAAAERPSSTHLQAGTNAFHPTPAGYVAYAAAISAVLPSSWGANQEQVA